MKTNPEPKEELKPIKIQEQGRIMPLDEAISMLQRANDYLEKCDWSNSCPCGSCWKCAVQRMNREISELQDENTILKLRKTDERVASETIFRLRKEISRLEEENKKMKVILENIKNVTPKKGAVNEWCRVVLREVKVK